MAHCTPVGFEAKKKFGLNSDPKHWDEVLKIPRFKNLRLCLGHAGGGDYIIDGTLFSNGWYEMDDDLWNSENNYPRKVIDLCQKRPNVYADLSYLHAMIHSANKRNAFIKRLKDAIGIQQKKPYDFGDKIIYGSDWPMADIVNETNQYLDMFQGLFEDSVLKDYRDRFFFLNAIKYLNLKYYVEVQINSSQPVHSTLGLSHLKQMAAAAK
jgi:predicted TIM-barrel fold metal-dependent hydrolase